MPFTVGTLNPGKLKIDKMLKVYIGQEGVGTVPSIACVRDTVYTLTWDSS